jgi:NDP-sugar pyrophosphorylase family protein
MNGLIVACGKRDSLGAVRVTEERGLFQAAGKPVIRHTLEALTKAGVKDVYVLVDNGSRKLYERELSTEQNVHLVSVSLINNKSFLVFMYGILRFGWSKPLFVSTDDNLFTFSLDSLVEKQEETGDSVLLVREESRICADGYTVDSSNGLNFGRIILGENGRIAHASVSFSRAQINSRYVAIDIWLFSPSNVRSIAKAFLRGPAHAKKTIYGSLWGVVINTGFWADVGKPPLRLMASQYFSA